MKPSVVDSFLSSKVLQDNFNIVTYLVEEFFFLNNLIYKFGFFIKVGTFWEAYKIWNNLLLEIWRYWMSNFLTGRFFQILSLFQNVPTSMNWDHKWYENLHCVVMSKGSSLSRLGSLGRCGRLGRPGSLGRLGRIRQDPNHHHFEGWRRQTL